MPIAKGKKGVSASTVSRKNQKAASPGSRRGPARPKPTAKPVAKSSKKTAKAAARPKLAARPSKPAKPVRKTAVVPAKKKAAPVKAAAPKKPQAKTPVRPVVKAPVKTPVSPDARAPLGSAVKPPAKTAGKAPVVSVPPAPEAKRAAIVKAAPVAPAPSAVRAAKAAKPASTRPRRPRLRISPDTGPVATWLASGERPRPSSFIPAPHRAESPSTVAAPPASSDRLISPAAIEEALSYRTVPVRIDIEQSAGRTIILPNPLELTMRNGEGIEWDFRYINGSDVVVQEITIDFPKPAPFLKTAFRSVKPGSARPHRLISGQSQQASAGRRYEYVVRCLNILKTEIANERLYVTVV